MNLENISNLELRDRLNKLVRAERKITHLILAHINEFESRKLFAEYGYANMFEYLTRALGYSETSAYRRLQSARVIKLTPEIAQKVEAGAINLSQLTEVQKHIRHAENNGDSATLEKKQALFAKLENKTIFQTKAILAQEFDLPLHTYTQLTPQKDESVRAEMTFTKEQFSEIQKAQDLLSHVCPNGELTEIFVLLAKKFNQSKLGTKESCKKDTEPLNSKANQTVRLQTSALLTQGFAATQLPKRDSIKKSVKRLLFQNAEQSCEFVGLFGHRCGSTYQLQIDHKIPHAKGGSSSYENLRILCRTHNNLMARRWNLIN